MSLIFIGRGLCPNCKKEKIFTDKGNLLKFKIPKMNSYCKNCNYLFEKEAGFFFGAMFVSYALIVAEAVSIFVLFNVLLGFEFIHTFLIIILLITCIGTLNYRLSRIIWIYLFYPDKE